MPNKTARIQIQYLGKREALEALQSDELDWVSWLENQIVLEQAAAHPRRHLPQNEGTCRITSGAGCDA